MATVSYYLEKRYADAQGRYPIKLRIMANSTNTTVSTRVYCPEKSFRGNPDHVLSRKFANARALNAELRELYYMYVNALLEIERTGRIEAMTAADIREYVNKQKEFTTERTFTGCFQEYRDACRTEGTRKGYDYTKQMIERFCSKDKLFFEDINYKFLTDLERFMEDNGIGMSTRSIVFRNIRAVYNYAINNDWVAQNTYPFRRFKIKQGHKEKVYLPEDGFQKLLSLNLTGYNQHGLALARDFFVLSFCFCGINPIDLYNLPKSDGKISFIRTKLKHREPEPIHIGIQPEAELLISEYCGSEHLLNLPEHYHSFTNFYHFIKHRMKVLGEMIGYPDMSLYWARYTWATYASKLDISDSTISKALGHADRSLAEKRYISFDWRKVDRANRRVIDYAIYQRMDM